MRDPKTHRYDDGPTACRPSSAVLKSIQQAINALDRREPTNKQHVDVFVSRPTGLES